MESQSRLNAERVHRRSSRSNVWLYWTDHLGLRDSNLIKRFDRRMRLSDESRWKPVRAIIASIRVWSSDVPGEWDLFRNNSECDSDFEWFRIWNHLIANRIWGMFFSNAKIRTPADPYLSLCIIMDLPASQWDSRQIIISKRSKGNDAFFSFFKQTIRLPPAPLIYFRWKALFY